MKKVFFLGLSLILMISAAGCAKKSGNINNTAAPVEPVANNQTVNALKPDTFKKFYPDSNPINKAATAPVDPARSFMVTQELELKLYLVDKYNPGTCYGLPGPVPDVAVTGTIQKNPELSQFLKNKYKLNSDLEIYNKIKQINGIALTKAGGKYEFNFTNGQCCTLTAYEGEISIIGQTVSDVIIQQETKQNPC